MSEFKWKTAIYLRYSDKEDGKSESGSIETQRSMLRHILISMRTWNILRSMRMIITLALILIDRDSRN